MRHLSLQKYRSGCAVECKNSGNANIKVKTTDAGAEIAFRVSITELKIEGIEIEQGETCSAQIDSTLQLTTKITPVEASVKRYIGKVQMKTLPQ